MNSALGLKQFRSEGCLTYVVWDRASSQALVIDPLVEMVDTVREFMAGTNLKPTIVLDTHIHADHLSGSHLLRDHFSIPVCMSSKTRSVRATRKVSEGDLIQLGTLTFKVLETPGHTPDAICIYGHGLVFTGDTLLIGATGRTDFPGSDSGQLFDSAKRLLSELPPQTVVLPGHDYNQILFTTLEAEARMNVQLVGLTRDAFIEIKREESIAVSTDDLQEKVKFNTALTPAVMGGPGRSPMARTACGSASVDADRFASLSVDKYRQKLAKPQSGTAYLDVREPDEYEAAHIAGTKNIPLSELALALGEFTPTQKIFISCLSGRRSGMAAKTLSYLGYRDVVNVSGGFQAWSQSGFEVVKKP